MSSPPLSVQRVALGANVVDLVWVVHKRHLGDHGCGRKGQGSTAGRHRTAHANLGNDIAILATAHDELRLPICRLVTSLQVVNERLREHGGASVVYCKRRTALHWSGLCGSDLVHGSTILHRCSRALRCMPICDCCKTPGAPSQFITTPVTVDVFWSAGA